MNTKTLHRLLRLIFTLGIIVGSSFSAFAQVSNLNFTQTTATYAEITGGTVVATASGTTGAASLDDVVYTLPASTIPFTFTFDNTGYTGLNISTNGFLTFGTTAPAASGSTTGYTPISATTAYAGCVSALGRNLNAYFTGVSTQTGEIRYQTLGASPNRVFVVQWKNFKVFTYTGAYGPVLNFQVRLSETTNAVEIVYNCSGAFTSTTAQVGLRGPNNIFPTNVNNRQVAAASNTWITSAAGTANTSTCEFSGSLLPPIGLTYRFAQPPCPNPQNATATNVTQNSAQLTWTTTGGGGTFTIEYGLSGFTPGSGTVQTGVNSGVTISGLSANTAYQFYVTQNCGSNGNSQRVGPISFSTGGPGEDCATAPTISVANNLGSCVFTTVSSGVSSNGPNAICSDVNGNTPNDDRWYKFVAPSTGDQLVLYTTAGTANDWVMEVWSACPGSGSVIKCSDDVNGAMPEIRLCQNEYTPGNTYYIRIWTYSTSVTGTANLCVYKDLECPIPPVNDECVDARVLQVNSPGACPAASQRYTTKYATPNIDGATCDAGTKRDVWFVFNSGNFSDISMTITPVSATTLKAQLLFECGGFELYCYNPANGTYTFTNLNPVADYIIRVWSDTLTAGTFDICLFSNCTAPTATIGSGTTICSGQSATLPITFTGTAPWTFSYRNDVTGSVTSVTTSSNPYNLVVSPTVTTGYTLLTVSDAQCSGAASGTALVTVGGAGQTPVVSGNASVCRGQIGLVYSTPAQSGSTYSWTVPTGVTITAGQGTNSITTTWSTTAVAGNVSVTATNSCGTNTGSLAVSVGSAPVSPLISGSASVCRGASSIGYSTTAQTGVTYTWTVPTGVTITAGQGTNSITTSWSASAVSGNVSVSVSNSCGSQSGVLAVTALSGPTAPTVSGNSSVCPNQTGVVYSTTAQTGMSYSWTVPTGVTITSGQGTNSITTSWGSTAVSGNVSVTVSNSCGSQSGSLAVSISTTPAAPVVSGPATACLGQTGLVYSTTAQTGVSYNWTVPTGVTITAGQGTNSITTTWSSTAVSGNVTLTITTTCGSNSGSLAVTVSSSPNVPTVSGSASVCRGASSIGYSTTAQTGVTYTWTVPTGVTITAGQGTNSITTSWSSTAVSGNVSVSVSNSCGSQSGVLAVTALSGPTAPTVSG
ncbi:MAG: fibronectin type III domain-containing protein, partial [Bacteroidota bacterium]